MSSPLRYEPTRQDAEPVELYKFFWGNSSVSGTSAGGGVDPTVFGSTLPSCEGVAAPTFTVVETWTGGDDTDIDGRALSGGIGTWAKNTLATSRIDIVGGVAVLPAIDNIFPEYRVTGTSLAANQSVKATFKFTSNPGIGEQVECGVLARVDTSGADKSYALYCNRQKDGLGNIHQAVGLQLWNDPDYTTLSTYSTAAFALNELHTIRLDCVGNKIYGYLDDVLVVFGTDSSNVRTSGDPGFFEDRVDPLLSSVAVTRWEAGIANTPGNDSQVAAYGLEHWDGPDDPNIDGRELDGGGSLCLQGAVWTDTIPARPSYGRIESNDCHHTERNPYSPGDANWKHYVAKNVTGLGNDYRVEATVDLIAQPPGLASPDSAWASLLARHVDNTESGYEFVAQFAAGGPGVGGMSFKIYSVTNEIYTTLAGPLDRLTGEVDLGEHTIAIHVSGNRICGYFDGELILVTADPNNTYPSGGYPGICLNGSEVVIKQWAVFGDPATQPCEGSLQSTDPLLTLNYTTADLPITYEGEVYTPFVGARSSLQLGTGESSAHEIDLWCPLDHPIATLAETGVPRGPIGVIVYRLDRQDLSDGSAALILQGQIIRHMYEGRKAVLTLGNLGTLLARKVPRMLAQRHCPHVLYGPFCQLSLAAHTHEGLSVTGVSGRVITVSGASAIALAQGNPTYFQEGVLVTADGLREFIVAQSGDNLTLKQILPGLDLEDLTEGTTVTLLAGCTHTASACDLLGNIEHFGGEIGIKRNPFTGAGLADGPGELLG